MSIMAALPRSLRARLVLLFAVALAPMLAVFVVAAALQWRAAAEEARSGLQRQAVLAAAGQQRMIEGARQVLEVLARAPQAEHRDAGSCADLLRALPGDRRWFAGLGVLDADGNPRCEAPPRRHAAFGGDIIEALKRSGVATAASAGDRGAAWLYIGQLLHAPDGREAGLLYAVLDAHWLVEVAADLALPAGAALRVVDRNGSVLASWPPAPDVFGDPIADATMIAAAAAGSAGAIAVEDTNRGRLVAYAPVGGLGQPSLFVALEHRAGGVMQALAAVPLPLTGALLAIVAMTLAGASLAARALVLRPLQQLAVAARSAAAGEPPQRCAGALPAAGELGELSRAMAEMTASFERRIAALSDAEDRLAETSTAYRKLFFDNPLPMWLYDRETFRFLEVNGSALQHYGYTRDEFRAMTLWDIRPPEDRPLLAQALQKLPDVRRSSGIWRHLRKDGSIVRVEITSHDTEWDGRPARLVLAYDVTERDQSADALSQLQARYRTLVELSPESIYIHRDGRFTFLNSAAVRFFRARDAGQMIGRQLYDFVLPAFQPDVRERVDRMQRGEILPRVQQRMRVLDGTELDVEVSAAPIVDDGKPAFMVVLRDITDQKRAEQALKTSEERFRALTVLNADWYWEQDAQLRFVELVQGWEGGYPTQRYIGKTRWELPYLQASDEAWAQHKALLAAHQPFYDFETARLDDDGQIVGYNSISGYPIFDKDGRFRGYRGVGKDITERKRAQMALEESENRYRTLVDLSPDPIYLHRDGVFTFLNRAALEFFRAPSADALIGMDSLELVVETQRARSRDRVRRLMAGESVPRIELSFRCLDGELYDVELAASIIEQAGERTVMVILRDITERKRAQRELQLLNEELERRVRDRTAQLEASNRELEAFAYSVSHDLRAPLRTIDGFSAAVIEDHAHVLDAQGQDYLGRIRAATERMSTLIDDLLALSRVSRSEFRRQPVDLTRMVQGVVRELEAADAERQVEAVVEAGMDAHGDPGLLRVLMQNLLDNAWKFTRLQARPQVHVGRQVQDGKTVFFVRDNGVGFDMNYAAKLFGVFQRLHSQRDFEGSGIGLATAQRIVRRHGGRIWADASVDRGAVFYFTLD